MTKRTKAALAVGGVVLVVVLLALAIRRRDSGPGHRGYAFSLMLKLDWTRWEVKSVNYPGGWMLELGPIGFIGHSKPSSPNNPVQRAGASRSGQDTNQAPGAAGWGR